MPETREIFGAIERVCLDHHGKIIHAELQIADSVVLFCDELPEAGMRSPASVGGSPMAVSVQVPDADATYQRAVQAGATPIHPVETLFHGARVGGFTDPYGHNWQVLTHIEDVPPEEMQRRMASALGG
ncbi:hypothetical protein GCM10012275_30490 [Longimycelium tulufanense]|uniref:Glyoxalase/fosfomycin resistance/dioxygenase domain-containing protein n=1 Tax=Longimycelium tulufanense TaxID=907463 RepID=A0A8J3C8R3_9PSEU|nr:VOC family protein [Longimycelium tulufanense]GGM57292.1 hypothetical protein GCM10012275_30490 [Longimycelium tulufanense]